MAFSRRDNYCEDHESDSEENQDLNPEEEISEVNLEFDVFEKIKIYAEHTNVPGLLYKLSFQKFLEFISKY